MNNSEKTLNYFEKKNKGVFKKLKVKLKHRMGWLGIPRLVPYRGFGSHNTKKVFITGVLTEDKGLEKPGNKNSAWGNILAMLKRYASDQIPGAGIGVEFNGVTKELITEETGLFKTAIPYHSSPAENKSVWIEYEASLHDPFIVSEKKLSGKGEILIPGEDAKFGVISDIDDTIMLSHSTKTLRKLRLMLTRNSRTRKPFPGVEAFYRALHAGADGTSKNPFFYISSSEWNLYDLIEDFCTFNQFPKGVFLLREINPGFLNLLKQGGGSHEHKFEKITRIFETYPDMPFVLVGDNGQHDPAIYSRIAHKYPDRVKAIYIRTVKKQKDDRMKKITYDLEKINVQIVFTPDTINAAQHAQSRNLIARPAVEAIIKNSLTD
jgi:phosphatidate phosphatase APP1